MTLNLEISIIDKQLTYYGHIIQMDNNRPPLITIEGSTKGTRPSGRPPKRCASDAKKVARGLVLSTYMRLKSEDSLGISIVGEPSTETATLTMLTECCSQGYKKFQSWLSQCPVDSLLWWCRGVRIKTTCSRNARFKGKYPNVFECAPFLLALVSHIWDYWVAFTMFTSLPKTWV